MKQFLSKSLQFNCEACGRRLREDWRTSLLALVVGMLPAWYCVGESRENMAYLWGLLPALAFYAVVDYGLLNVFPGEESE